MALNDTNKNAIAFKKVVGKAHTQQTFAFNEEGITSNLSISYTTIFSQNINPKPVTSGGLSALYSNDGIVEKVKFELELIPDTLIGTNQSQGYRLKLPSNYTSLGFLRTTYSGGTILYKQLGRLQVVPSIYGELKTDGSTEYDPILYQTNGTTVISKFDSIDWILDAYNGVLFVQTPPTNFDVNSSRPGYLEAFLYVGKYLDQFVSNSVTVAGPNHSVQFRNVNSITGTTTFMFVPTANSLTIGTRNGALGFNSFSIGSGNTVSAANSGAFGAGSLATGVNSLAINLHTTSSGVASLAGGNGIVTKKISAAGVGAFNFSTNDISQISGHGAIADKSVILGGLNNNIDSGNIGSAIIAGNTIKLTGSSYQYTTAISNLAIFGALNTGATGDTFLVIDPATKKVRGRTSSDIISTFGSPKGITNSIQFNNGGTFSGITQFILDKVQRAVTIGTRSGSAGVNSLVVGNSGEATGLYTVSFGDNTNADGKATLAGGTNTDVNGDNSLVWGESNVVNGHRSFAYGYNNTSSPNLGGILGGQNNTLVASNTGATIIGGNGINLTGTTYGFYTIMQNLALWSSPIAGGTDDVLTWNSTTKKVGKVTQASLVAGTSVVITTAAAFTATTANYYIGCSGITNQIYLPALPFVGQEIIIDDTQGDAYSNPITINGNGKLIVGFSTALINTDYGSITMIYNGYKWGVIAFSS